MVTKRARNNVVSIKKLILSVALLVLVAAVSCLPWPKLALALEYEVIDLGTLGGPYATPHGINNNGIVVGISRTDSVDSRRFWHAFSWQDGQISDLGTFAGWSRAYAINSTGLIVGYSETVAGSPYNAHAVSWMNNVITDLGTLGGSNSAANDVNDSGVIVGEARLPSNYHHAVIWYPGGGITDLGTLGGTRSTATAINNNNVVVGASYLAGGGDYKPFLWDNGQWTELGTLGGVFGWPNDINDKGQVVGRSHVSGSSTDHAVMWYNGAVIDLLPEGYESRANAINNYGMIVGEARIWIGGKVFNLNNMIPPDAGIRLEEAWDINDSGWIVATGNAPGSHGHAFLLIPIPESITIDIKPGSDPNSINFKSKGKIPVAILSTTDFDAPSQVDQNSLTFGSTGDEVSLAFCNHRGEDINGDGLEDLVCHFYTKDTEFLCGDTEGVLKGMKMEGTPIEGKDSVRIVPCEK